MYLEAKFRDPKFSRTSALKTDTLLWTATV